MENQTLVLDQGYQAVQVMPWQQAITLVYLKKAVVVAEYDAEVRSVSMSFRIPAVISLRNKIKRDKKPAKFSRANVYARDGYRCQYCTEHYASKQLTYDHVLPRSRGGKTEFTNIVAACRDCNGRKASRTPAEAGMKLHKKPVEPVDLPTTLPVALETAPAPWLPFLH